MTKLPPVCFFDDLLELNGSQVVEQSSINQNIGGLIPSSYWPHINLSLDQILVPWSSPSSVCSCPIKWLKTDPIHTHSKQHKLQFLLCFINILLARVTITQKLWCNNNKTINNNTHWVTAESNQNSHVVFSRTKLNGATSAAASWRSERNDRINGYQETTTRDYRDKRQHNKTGCRCKPQK